VTKLLYEIFIKIRAVDQYRAENPDGALVRVFQTIFGEKALDERSWTGDLYFGSILIGLFCC